MSSKQNGPSTESDATNATDSSYRILVPILDSDIERRLEGDVERLLQTARAIARNRDGEILIRNILHIPEQTPLSLVESDAIAEQARQEVDRFIGYTEQLGKHIPVSGGVCITHDEVSAILDLTSHHDCSAVLLGVRDESSQRRRLLSGDTVEKLAARAKGDVFVQRFGGDSPQDNVGSPPEQPQRILLAAAEGPHSGLASEIAEALAAEADAQVDVVHGVAEDATDGERVDAENVVEAAAHALSMVDVETTIVETDTIAEEIIERSDEYDVTVIGAPTQGLLKQFVYGSDPERVRSGADETVLMAKENTPVRTSLYYRWLKGDDVRANSGSE
ncbi:universal stress protein [Halococcus sp. PRR34]|uniref:universal stress protein n=1 Tax=Halococcus sp. PRR34 TaxID=3020830 RepID=UPI002361C555|nr:universal stress protein [Halococcus sp. PRR34]